MYLPRDLISHLYIHLRKTTTAQSPPVLILVSLEPDALCACHILTALLRRDYIQHHIQPVSGYGDLEQAGLAQIHPMRLQNGGSGGTVICLGVGGMVDLVEVLRLEATTEEEDPFGGVEIWIVDARRPWHLNNVFGGRPPERAARDVNGDFKNLSPEVTFGRLNKSYTPGKGGIIIYDDGDIEEELDGERHAFFELEAMPEVEDDGEDLGDADTESEGETNPSRPRSSKKRKSSSAEDDGDSDGADEDDRERRKRRRSSSGSVSSSSPDFPRANNLSSDDTLVNGFHSRSRSPSLPPSAAQPSPASLRRRLLRIRRKHASVIDSYFSLGTSYSEPISSILYSLASALGREENNFLWDAIVGVSSLELYGRAITGANEPLQRHGNPTAASPWHGTDKYERIKAILRDEVRRLNPPTPAELHAEAMESSTGVIPTTGRSPTDTSIRLSPEPRVLLLRHWSLYESMMHSPYLSTHLLVWTPVGVKRVGKLLAKMGISIRQSKQNYTHMDMDLKRTMRQQLLKYCPQYNLEGLVPPVVRGGAQREGWGFVRSWGWKACLSAMDVATVVGAILEVGKAGAAMQRSTTNGDLSRGGMAREVEDPGGEKDAEEFVGRFWEAYDALGNVDKVQHAIPLAQNLHRSILSTGSALLEKHQIRHLRAFRFAVVKDGPDVGLFTHPSTLLKLSLWLGEAIAVQNGEYALHQGKSADKGITPLVMAALNERRGVFTVVGTGGGGTINSGADKERDKERAEKKAWREEKRAERERARERKRRERERRRARRKEEHPDEDDGSETDSEDESEDSASDSSRSPSPEPSSGVARRAFGKNRFGIAFQEVVDQTSARVRIDSFENCVVEVKREDLKPFLEALSEKAVIGR